MAICFVDHDAGQPLYQHLPLKDPNNFIRLLELHPSTGGRKLLGSIIHQRLEDAYDSYEALSYVWNPSECPRSTESDSQNTSPALTLKITVNLYQILRRLEPPADGSPRRLWIDQVCINQSDETEKLTQILIMDKIYHYANNVLIWLGNGNVQVERAMTMIGNAQGLSGLHLAEQNIADLNALFTCEWFTRLWVVQEASCARCSEAMCGNTFLSFREIVEAAYQLSQQVSSVQCQNAHVIWYYKQNLPTSFTPDRFAEIPGRSLHFDLFMDLFRRFKCSQQIDRYMALGAFGFWQQSTNPFVSMAQDWSAKEFYTFITYSSIVLSGNLTTICSAGTRNSHGTPNWPSWVPDYSPEGVANRPLLPYGYHKSEFNATGRWAIPQTVRELTNGPWVVKRAIFDLLYSRRDERLLRVGKRISSVQKVCEQYKPDATLRGSELQTDKETISHWYNEIERSRANSDSCCLRADFSRMLVADGMMRMWFTERRTNSVRSKKMLLALLQSWENRKNQPSSSVGWRLSSVMTDFLQEINECCRGQRLFLLENGSYGLCPPETTQGDIVCLLQGGKAPFILRPAQYQGRNGYFKLIGDCYVNGLMYGEGANWWEIWTERFWIV